MDSMKLHASAQHPIIPKHQTNSSSITLLPLTSLILQTNPITHPLLVKSSLSNSMSTNRLRTIHTCSKDSRGSRGSRINRGSRDSRGSRVNMGSMNTSGCSSRGAYINLKLRTFLKFAFEKHARNHCNR